MRYVFIFLALVTNAVTAQQHYVFSTSTESYSDLQNASNIFPAHFGEGEMTFLSLDGETFDFFGVDFPFGGIKTFVFQSNGNLRIDNDTAMVIIDGAFTFLDSIDATSSLSYLIEGTMGNKIVKAQWKNLKIRNGADGNFMNLQIWVHQNSGVIELRYGPRSGNNASGFTITNGPNVGMFFALDDFSLVFEKLWLNGSPSNLTLDSTANLSFKALSGLPEENTVYRFTPKILTGIEAISVKSPYIVYPNPTDGMLRILNDNDVLEITVIDVTGRILKTTREGETLDVEHLSPGVYGLTIRSQQGTFQHKLVKR